MLKLEKKQVKVISVTIAVCFVLGIVGLALAQTNTSFAAKAASQSNIGVVNDQLIMQQHPDLAKVQETMKTEVEQAKKDFEAKSANMNEQEKQQYYMQLQQRLSLKNQELMAPVLDKVRAAIQEVATAKGLSVVLDKNNVVYGGQDITDEVIKKVSGK
ncbi:putative secreted protein [Propionispora sp. 2/2-37]|uniref:OmpH family outer membrane protein n=1 Tax=Propionispora sp. 2/2-37 TaxID=1677858 RepID=UPI0006BB53F2|nr:OmpH family outer membrane protein [Propionispora sp. 2/2-37]CUH94544.1 putative secreted protein [Propionispora sp. 2/2-37]